MSNEGGFDGLRRKPLSRMRAEVVGYVGRDRIRVKVLAGHGQGEEVVVKTPVPDSFKKGEVFEFDIKGASLGKRGSQDAALLVDVVVPEKPEVAREAETDLRTSSGGVEPAVSSLSTDEGAEVHHLLFAGSSVAREDTPPAPLETEEVLLVPDEEVAPKSIETSDVSPELPVIFHKEKGNFTVTVEGKEYVVINARGMYLLPSDLVKIEKVDERRVKVTEVVYGSPRTVAGFIDTEISQRDQSSNSVFVVRLPGPSSRRVMHKFKFPVDEIPDAETYRAKGKPLLFDRVMRSVLTHPVLRSRRNSYEEARWVTLTNLGVYQYNEERAEQMKEEEAEISVLSKTLGISEDMPPASWDSRMESYMVAKADEEVRAGKRKDYRGEKTYTIDPEGSHDHDDAFSLTELEDGWSRLAIHIADVAEFVKAGSAVDIEAAFRSTSMYLSDETLRMLPSLISEHAASLKQGATRFAFSFVLEVKKDDHKGLRVRNMHFQPSVISVTENRTYEEVDALFSGTENQTIFHAVREIVEGFRKRAPMQQLGETLDIEPVDSHELVAQLMTMTTRAAGISYERLKRSGKRNVRLVQEVVSGIYRQHTVSGERAQKLFKNELMKLGIMTAEEIQQALSFDSIVLTSRRRVYQGLFSTDTTEAYYKAAFGIARYASTGYSTDETVHFGMGHVISRVTSPIRRYADLLGQRTLKYLLALQEHSSDTEDLTEEESRTLINTYIEEVLGVPVPENAEELTLAEYVDLAMQTVQTHLSKTLAHASVRESLSQKAENAEGVLKTVTRMYRRIHGQPWRRNIELVTGGRPIRLRHGIVVDIPDGSEKKSREEVYGDVRISYKSNTDLKGFVAGRVGDQGVSVQVKYTLPKGMQHPAAWCRTQGLSRCRVKLYGSISEVEVEQGRLVLSVEEGRSYEVPRSPRTRPLRRR